jgi:hypothetical protein
MTDPTLLLTAAVAAGSLVAGMALAKMPEGYKPPIEDIDWDAAKAKFRADHGVRPMDEEDAGKPVDTVTPGVYGFTYAASFSNPVPVFVKPSFQSFEYHRLPNGDVVVLGCVRKQDAELLEAGDFAAVRLYPEPYDDAVAPVAIAYKHIQRSNNKVSRASGNYIEFDVKRAG